MAMVSLLRNAARTNLCSGLARSTKICSPFKQFTTLVAGQQRNAAVLTLASKPLALQFTKPLVRSLQLSAPRASGHGNHATIWKAERILASSLLVVLPAAFLSTSQVTDALLASVFILHAHWGIEAIVVDYVRPSLFGTFIPKVSVGLVYFFSITCLAGLLNLIYNDIGLVGSIKRLWAIRYKEPEPEPDPKDKKKKKAIVAEKKDK